MTGANTFAFDTSTYLTVEADPIFAASPAFGIATTSISNWNTAYSWGDHAGAGYLTSTALTPYSTKAVADGLYLGIGATATNSNLLENHNAAYFQIAGSYLTPTSSLDPSNVAQTATYRFVSDAEKSTWNGKQAGNANLTSLSGLSYSSGAPFIKMTGANTFAFDTSTYLTSLSGALLTDGTVTGAIAQAQTFTNGIISNATSTFTGNVGIGTSSLAGAKFKIAVDSSAIADNYSDLSKISSNTNAAAVSGKLQISEAICGNYTVQGAGGLTYGTVLGPDGKCWMTKNLGAAQVATTATDANSYGYYYQWGRLTDGHQIENSGTTGTLSTLDDPGHSNFITSTVANFDWKTNGTKNNALWGDPGIGGPNNPCPTGWHVPTQPEWATVAGYFSPQTSVGAFNSTLKLPLAGYRGRIDAALYYRGSYGYYWSSSPSGTNASNLSFDSGGVDPANANNRAYGFSVRCVKD